MGQVNAERLLLLLHEAGVTCSYDSAQHGVVVSEVEGSALRPPAVIHLPLESPPTINALDDQTVEALYGVRDPHVAAVDLLSVHLVEILQTRPVEGARLEIESDGTVVVRSEREPVADPPTAHEPVVIYAPMSQEYYSINPGGEREDSSQPQE